MEKIPLCPHNLMIAVGILTFVFCLILAITMETKSRKEARKKRRHRKMWNEKIKAMERYNHKVALRVGYLRKPPETHLKEIVDITADVGMEDLSTGEAIEFMKSMWRWSPRWWITFRERILLRNCDPYNPRRRRGDILRAIEAEWYRIELT